MSKKFFIEAIKYGVVGIINTFLTLLIIWLLRSVLGTSLVFANATGYTTGFICSFLLNRSWTFKANNDWIGRFIKFLAAFLVCYLIQLGFVLLLKKWTVLQEGYITLLGMIVYTCINFPINKYITFQNKFNPDKSEEI
ncbi:MAG: GtrA family protein [Dysgonamonadaceae bacterium]|jgi:putative flippase GtrA|nr:GtrA family protein [Dysgonamonadaceae bacterium]